MSKAEIKKMLYCHAKRCAYDYSKTKNDGAASGC
jgi:hypothetical protein